MRGDRPGFSAVFPYFLVFTPHARGSTLLQKHRILSVLVYPACAGIDLHWRLRLLQHLRLPRMRGDRPVKNGVYH